MRFLMDKNWNSNIIKSLSLWLLILLLGSGSPEYSKLGSIKVKAHFLTTDNLRNAYLVNNQNQLLKYSPEGQLLFTYNSKRYGTIGFVDARNPFKLRLSYPEFATIVTLDKLLAETHIMNLLELGIPRLGPICTSSDNQIWIYDEQELKLKKIDQFLNVILESDPLFTILSAEDIHPNFMVERNNWVYMNEPNIGILVFDIFGTYAKTLPIKGLSQFQVRQDQLIYFQDGVCHFYHLKTLQQGHIPLPDVEGLKSISVEKDRLFLLSENHLDLYAY